MLRKSLEERLPEIDKELIDDLSQYPEKNHGLPFLFNGVDYLTLIKQQQEEVEFKKREKDRERHERLRSGVQSGGVSKPVPPKTPTSSVVPAQKTKSRQPDAIATPLRGKNNTSSNSATPSGKSKSATKGNHENCFSNCTDFRSKPSSGSVVAIPMRPFSSEENVNDS